MIKQQFYSGSLLDRASHARDYNETDFGLNFDALESRVITIHNDRIFINSSTTVRIAETFFPDHLTNELYFLGVFDGRKVLCADVSGFSESDMARMFGHGHLADVRDLIDTVDREEAALLAYARGLVRWNKTHAYCGSCGSKTHALQRGHSRKCVSEACGAIMYPRIDPAIIVTIEHRIKDQPSRILLQKRPLAKGYRCSPFAGFVEIGESLEDAVKREVMEEVHLPVEKIKYVSSQPWPFPASIMVGFNAVAKHSDFKVDGIEIKDAAWYTAHELISMVEKGEMEISRPDSIARFLIEKWIDTNLK